MSEISFSLFCVCFCFVSPDASCHGLIFSFCFHVFSFRIESDVFPVLFCVPCMRMAFAVVSSLF